MKTAPAFAFVLALSAAPLLAGDDDWPQWLGPTRDGAARAASLKPGRAPRLVMAWKRPLGPGGSGIVVADSRAFTLFSDEESEYAVALAAGDGRELWRVKLDPLVANVEGPNSTPLIAGGTVVTLSSACQLRALDAATGKVVWQRDMKADFGVKLGRGCATSPLLEAGQLIVQAGGRENEQRVVALEPATGKTVWTSRGTERTTYTSPVVADIGGVRQLVVHHTIIGPPPKSALMGLRLTDQSVLWSRPLEKLSFDTPLVLKDAAGATVVLGSWSDTSAVKVSGAGGTFQAQPGWNTGELSSNVSPPVFRDGHLYGFGGDFLACVDAATGRAVWKERLYPGSVILVGDRLVVLSVSSGLVRLVQATPAGYREEGKVEVFNRGARADTPPSFAGGQVFVRNDEEIVAVRVEG
jgi:outer membrane protein assembly factor BamB